MIYAIISNFIFAALLAIIFAKYLRLKKDAASQIDDLQQKFDEEVREVDNTKNQMRATVKADNEKIDLLTKEISDLRAEKEFLFHEIAEIRKEKEDEMKLRLETEKQIVLALQKTEDVQKRMHDWKVTQDAAMKDSQSAIMQVGDKLYSKLNASHQMEVEANKIMIQKVAEFLNKTSTLELLKSVAPEKSSEAKNSVTKEPEIITTKNQTLVSEEFSKKLPFELLKSMKEANHAEGIKYFLPTTFDSSKAKGFFCESAFLKDKKLYIFDFKACNFLQEYAHSENKSEATKRLTQKLDKYITYLGNSKYLESITKIVTSKSAIFDSAEIALVMPSAQDLEVLRQLGYYDKLKNVAGLVISFDQALDLTL
jgi:hypothetical protein